jgi:hypothetical protein
VSAVNHGERAHATWSASASARNFACPGALKLISLSDVPDDESEASAWGTACHQVSEKCLRQSVDAVSLIDTTERTKERAVEVDDELAETAQMYVDYVRGRLAEYDTEPDIADPQGAVLEIEQRFSLERINPPFDAGGTGDAVMYFPRWRHLEVVDLKGGRGVVVEVEGNKQLRTYALGAMLSNASLAVDRITVTVVQPRAFHRSGRIRSETFHVSDLMEWTAELKQAMLRSAEAFNAYATPMRHGWVEDYLNPGNHCASSFCKARATCPALQKAALDAAGVWFDKKDVPQLANTPDKLMPEDIAKFLDAADMIEGWVNAVRAYGHRQAEMGVVIPNYVLTPKQARRKFREDVTARTLAERTGRTPDDFLGTPKLITPAQADKVLGKEKDKISGLWSAESSGTNLCRAEKTTRAAVKPKLTQLLDLLDK